MNDTQEATDTTPDVRTFPALSRLERVTPPLRFGREPLWRLPLLSAIDKPLIPAWNWHAPHDFPAGTRTVTLDANGAYLGAIGQVSISASQLTHTGPIDYYPAPRDVAPGYYLITVPHWAFSGTIVSPLGNTGQPEKRSKVWVAQPTLSLLLELAEEGHIGAFDILDSWSSMTRTSFRAWYESMRAVRTQVLDQRDASHPTGTIPPKCACLPCKRYVAFKEGYSMALSMIATGKQSKTFRPDWSHAVYATHSANMWRKAWKYTGTNHHLVSMGNVDAMTILADDLQPAMAHHTPPFRFDQSGRAIGAMKEKEWGVITEEIPTATTPTTALVGPEAWDDVV